MKDKSKALLAVLGGACTGLILMVIIFWAAGIFPGKQSESGDPSVVISSDSADVQIAENNAVENSTDAASSTESSAASIEQSTGEESQETSVQPVESTEEISKQSEESLQQPETVESQEPETGKVENNGTNKGPDIKVGDRLAGHALQEGSPVGDHGRLRVEGGHLVDQNGKTYQMHGVSTHGIAWFPEFVSEESFRTFKNDWDADVIRIAMYSGEYNGYCTGGDQQKLKETVDKAVEYASKLGMYVIIDWHVLGDQDPNVYKDQAIAFFDEMSAKYAEYGNVIYEICNEPNGNVNWQGVKSYAVEVIDTIRANDPYGIILVGTPQWSQKIIDAMNDPIEDEVNIMYTLHFYAATHKEWLRNDMVKAAQNGFPVFVSECSICDASGNGGIDYDSAEDWVSAMDDNGISYIAWSISNKNETSALIKSSCTKTSDWAENELSETGLWFREKFKK